MLIGICGKSGCGKSTLAKQIVQYASVPAEHLDMDKIGHRVLLLPEVKSALAEAFGTDVLTENEVDRKKLSKIVFCSASDMEVLTRITWKHMEKTIDEYLRNNSEKLIVMDWLLLPKTKYFAMCEQTILLDIPYAVREQRAMRRDNISAEQFKRRDAAAIAYQYEMFDIVLDECNAPQLQEVVRRYA